MGTVTIGSFDGAGSFNAIQDKVVLKGGCSDDERTTRKVSETSETNC
ncbi:hypothetical protein N42HA_00203 [Lactococcus lactis]|nr:hypothetical protein [Lactococcus lactis]